MPGPHRCTFSRLGAFVWVGVSLATLGACGGSDRPPGADAGPMDDGGFHCQPARGYCTGRTHWVCGEDGASREEETRCESACSESAGCVPCVAGDRVCDGDVSYVCTDDARWTVVRDCAAWGSACGVGVCDDACGEAELRRRNVGCEFWAAPLANFFSPAELRIELFDFRLVLVNPNAEPVTVEIVRGDRRLRSVTLGPGRLEIVSLPWVDGMSNGLPPRDASSYLFADGAYRLRADRPISAFQFNPFEYQSGAAKSYSNDASLLYPSHALTGDYVGVSYSAVGHPDTARLPGYLAFVGTTEEPAELTIVPSAPVLAELGGAFEAAAAGETITLTLRRGEVLHLVVAGDADEDLSGTQVRATQPLAAFGGHLCANVPTDVGTCDHLESQLPPVQTLGKRFAGMPLVAPRREATNLLRVVAVFDGTTVRFEDGSSRTIAAGEVLDRRVAGPFRVEATEPVVVAQYLLGAGETDPRATQGDPSLTILVPEEQHRGDYVFVTPTSYTGASGQSYVVITRPTGAAVRLDGAPVVDGWTLVDDATEVVRVPVEGGTHRVEGDAPVGVMVFGLGLDTSYAYPAGLELERIVLL